MPESAHLWAIGYDDADGAERFRNEITALAGPAQYLLLRDLAILARNSAGSYTLDRQPFPAAGGLVTLISAEHQLRKDLVIQLVVGSLSALLTVGIVTMLRMLRRNHVSDQFKRSADTIRQIFADRFDGGDTLLDYRPFATHGNRGFGGLVHLVAVINGVLLSGILCAIVFCVMPATPTNRPIWASFVSIVGFAISIYLQVIFIKSREETSRDILNATGPTHAGGIVFTMRDGVPNYLLVRSSNNSKDEWLFPKGHIEAYEGHGQAALREVLEESGVYARIIGLVGAYQFLRNNENHRVKLYLMESLFEGKSSEARECCWLHFAKALNQLAHENNRYLLVLAERLRAASTGS